MRFLSHIGMKTLFYFLPIRIWGIILRIINYEFTKLYAKKKFSKLKNIFINFIKLGLIFVVIYVSISLAFGEYVYNLWLNNAYNFEYYLLILIVFDSVFFISAYSIASINRSINKFFKISLVQFIINLAIILASYLFFINHQSYFFLFLFNLFGTIIFFIYSFFYSLKLKIFTNHKLK